MRASVALVSFYLALVALCVGLAAFRPDVLEVVLGLLLLAVWLGFVMVYAPVWQANEPSLLWRIAFACAVAHVIWRLVQAGRTRGPPPPARYPRAATRRRSSA